MHAYALLPALAAVALAQSGSTVCVETAPDQSHADN